MNIPWVLFDSINDSVISLMNSSMYLSLVSTSINVKWMTLYLLTEVSKYTHLCTGLIHFVAHRQKLIESSGNEIEHKMELFSLAFVE